MPKTKRRFVLRTAPAAFFVLTTLSGSILGGDLSKYREFKLGTDLATIAKQTGMTTSRVEIVHQRPALIQELQWRPPSVSSNGADSVQDVVFSFCDGVLFRIVVNYDRYQTEGLTGEDIVQAVSATYGETSATIPVAEKSAQNNYGDQEKTVARWQDPQYRFDLIRLSYGPTFRLVGTLRSLDERAQAAVLEAKRLDDKEAPQREAARLASDQETAKTNLEKARLANKEKFRP